MHLHSVEIHLAIFRIVGKLGQFHDIIVDMSIQRRSPLKTSTQSVLSIIVWSKTFTKLWKLCKLDGLKTLVQKIDVWSSIERCLVVLSAANSNDVEELVLSRDNGPDYKLNMLSMKYKHATRIVTDGCAAVCLLTTTLRHCDIEKHCNSIYMLRYIHIFKQYL